MGKHDKECPRCKGAGEVMKASKFSRLEMEKSGTLNVEPIDRMGPVECSLCGGTGLVENDPEEK